jgi:hypothetical protein
MPSEPLSSNGRLCGAFLTAHFQPSGVMSQCVVATDKNGNLDTVFYKFASLGATTGSQQWQISPYSINLYL